MTLVENGPATAASVSNAFTFDTQHEDMIHDAQMDYYGKKLATCSSDRCIRLFEVEGDTQRLIEVLKGHEGPVWQVTFAHPKFGSLLASCSYDSSVIIWKQVQTAQGTVSWQKYKEHRAHDSSVNAIAWAPFELGLVLACASSDGKVSILSQKEDGSWDVQSFYAHQIGCNSVSWAPAVTVSQQEVQMRLVTGGCDNLVKVWHFSEGHWQQQGEPLQGHVDWVRDVAWSPNAVQPLIASCSQDKTVLLWEQVPNGSWQKRALTTEPFTEALWRLSWSVGGQILAVTGGDQKVSLWKQDFSGDWHCLSEWDESQQ